MDFNEYQRVSRKTALYPAAGNFYYVTLGLASEAGEVAGKIKKVMRDRDGVVDDQTRKDVAGELGDVLWYVAQLATELGLSLEDIAAANTAKLQSRLQRGTLGGDGDNR